MHRRQVLAALAGGALAASAGCLAGVRSATTCSPTASLGMFIENHSPESQHLDLTIRTTVLGRSVFSDSIEISGAEDPPGRTYHPERVAIADAVPNLRRLEVEVGHAHGTSTYSWRPRCTHLGIRLDRDGRPGFSVLSADQWARRTADDRS